MHERCTGKLQPDGETDFKWFALCDGCGQRFEQRKPYTPIKYTPAFMRRK